MLKDLAPIVLFRFGEQQWILNEVSGNLSFFCPGKFIWQAQHSENDVQGDQCEAIFARLRADDPRIEEMQATLKSDLEVIPDGPFCLLRRKSAKLKPIYCYYAYKAKDALEDGKPQHPGRLIIRHDFRKSMYTGFTTFQEGSNVIADDYRMTILALKPKAFLDSIKYSLFENNYSYEMGPVNYELLQNETFFIPPTPEYNELFYKSPKFRYQYEGRICLKNITFSHIFERKPLKIFPLNPEDYRISHEEVYMEFDVDIAYKPS